MTRPVSHLRISAPSMTSARFTKLRNYQTPANFKTITIDVRSSQTGRLNGRAGRRVGILNKIVTLL